MHHEIAVHADGCSLKRDGVRAAFDLAVSMRNFATRADRIRPPGPRVPAFTNR